jgi:hypothetical protein
MKKICSLLVLIYVVFGLFVLENVAADAWKCFKHGYSDEINPNNNVLAPWHALKVLTITNQ